MKKPATPAAPEAAALKRRKRALLAHLQTIPRDALPGSLALTHRRCGKSSCHCAKGAGHPFYSLTFMVDGKKHVESIPMEWIDAVRPAMDSSRGGVRELGGSWSGKHRRLEQHRCDGAFTADVFQNRLRTARRVW